jgi:hypothetical protein
MSQQPKERRKSRRVPTTFDLKLVGLGTPGMEAQALNLSAGGVYCLTPRYITPLTKVELTLILPPFQPAAGTGEGDRPEESQPAGATSGSESETKITAEGIVVRCDPHEEPEARGNEGQATPELYSLGIAFLHVAPEDYARIEAYVHWRLERSLIESADN